MARFFDLDRWRGEHRDAVVLLEEAGDGDMIIFSRWIRDLQSRVPRIYYSGTGTLGPVLHRQFGVMPVDPGCTLPESCAALAMMSLAHQLDVCQIDRKPYLRASADWVYYYQKILPKQKYRIGVCWSGAKEHLENPVRSVDAHELIFALSPLGEILSLQQQESAPPGVLAVDLQEWEQTLAIIDSCDVVVSVDTAVAHAAAAMGKPTVVLVHAACYYTWTPGHQYAQSPWYSDAHCIMQTLPGNWSQAISQASDFVRGLINAQHDHCVS